MQWLTAILAFATTMLVFAIIVSTIVETIHRVLGNRTDGLMKMLAHYYDEILLPYMKKPGDGQPEIARNDFLELMSTVRGPAIAPPTDSDKPSQKPDSDGPLSVRKNFQRLTNLPVLTFMERLGGSTFAGALADDKIGKGNKEIVLKDIAQKFEAYGHESAIHFERKARLKSVIIAFFVAWLFYVHPQDLIQTYLENPEVAAKVAEMNDDALKNHVEIEKLLKELEIKENASNQDITKEQIEELLKQINVKLDEGKEKVQLLVDAGAPIGWPAKHLAFCAPWDKASADSLIEWDFVDPDAKGKDTKGKDIMDKDSAKGDKDSAKGKDDANGKDTKNKDKGSTKNCAGKFQLLAPYDLNGLFWLAMGGLLIGLGAPFWAKSIQQLKQAQSGLSSVAGILKPEQKTAPADFSRSHSAATDEKPVTTLAYEVAEAATETVIIATMNAWSNANKLENEISAGGQEG